MKSESIQSLYLHKGFFLNEELADFMKAYAGQEISYPHSFTGSTCTARFFPPTASFCERSYGPYELTVAYLGEEIAPVGDCDSEYVELLLTKSGKLIGFADYLLLRWGSEDLKWRESLALLLKGVKATRIGVIDTSARSTP
jgi:hypothetical protein